MDKESREETLEELEALVDMQLALNDLICVVAQSGRVPRVEVDYDQNGRPQVRVSLEPEPMED